MCAMINQSARYFIVLHGWRKLWRSTFGIAPEWLNLTNFCHRDNHHMLVENFVISLVEMLQNGYIWVIFNVSRFVHHACFRIYIQHMSIVDTFTLVEENFVISPAGLQDIWVIFSIFRFIQRGCSRNVTFNKYRL